MSRNWLWLHLISWFPRWTCAGFNCRFVIGSYCTETNITGKVWGCAKGHFCGVSGFFNVITWVNTFTLTTFSTQYYVHSVWIHVYCWENCMFKSMCVDKGSISLARNMRNFQTWPLVSLCLCYRSIGSQGPALLTLKGFSLKAFSRKLGCDWLIS